MLDVSAGLHVQGSGSGGVTPEVEAVDSTDASTVFVTSADACGQLWRAAAAALTCSIGLLLADPHSGTQLYSSCRPLSKLQEMRAKKVKGARCHQSIARILSWS